MMDEHEPSKSEEEMREVTLDVSAGAPAGTNGDAVIDACKSALLPRPATTMVLHFDKVCCFVPAVFEVPGLWTDTKSLARKVGRLCKRVAVGPGGKELPQSQAERQILHDVTGCVVPGELMAIMGPSGSGKTTFISMLAGRNDQRSTGSILYNYGYSPKDKAFRRCLGYVMQEDAMYEGLTVYETLYYTALLRLPRNKTDQFKRKRVDVIMESLGVARCKDTIIGGFRVGQRGISGGEKKRVAIGQELLYNPSIILLDEPTSGLDSTTALRLLQTLSTMAVEGQRTIVTTIHQPSSRIYQMIDKLLLLGLGHVLYYGPASGATGFFACIGYEMPYGMNPADFLLDLASGLDGDARAGTFGAKDPQLKELRAAISKATPACMDFISTSKDGEQAEMQLSGTMADVTKAAEGPSHMLQCWVIAVRSLKDRRFERFNSDSLMTVFAMAVLCGLLWFQSGRASNIATLSGALDTSGLLFFMATFLSFNLLFSSIFTFPNEKTMLRKERQSGMYGVSAFFFGRTASDMPLDTIIPVVVTSIIYAFVGLTPSAGAFFLTQLALLLSCFVAASLGLLMGAWFLNLKRAQSIATIVMLTIMLAGGFFVRDIPVWIAWVEYISYIKYAWVALVKIHLRSSLQACEEAASAACVSSGFSDIDLNTTVWREIGILFAMMVLLRALVYVALRWGNPGGSGPGM